jgi:hypothetical protein
LHQLAQQANSAGQTILYKPRDGYRTRVAPHLLGPNIDYYLPSAPSGPVVVDILDANGQVVNSYSSAAVAAAPPRGGRGAGGGDPDDDMNEGRPGRGGNAPVSRVTAKLGHNRFVWDGSHQNGQRVAPGRYTAVLKVGGAEQRQAFNLLIDPRVAEEGVTAADLQELYDHNVRMRQLIADVNAAVQRVREGQRRFAEGTPERRAIDAVAAKLLTEPVRYGKPGLQAHITYLNGMGNGADMKVSRDAVTRYGVLRRELDAVVAELNRVLPPG